MGPVVLLDKSFIQSLGRSGSRFLSRYFYTNTTPLLALEILGDLSKVSNRGPAGQKAVRDLASRVHVLDSGVNVDAELACISSLLGGHIKMARQILVQGAYRLRTKSGESVGYIPENPVSLALLRWSLGRFSEGEAILANHWRSVGRSLDLESLKRSLGTPQSGLRSLLHLREAVDALLFEKSVQRALLVWFLDETRMVAEVRRWTLSRWDNGGYVFIRQFAPYAYHCLKVELFFSIGLQHGLITTRATNRLDMQYYWYCPFCQVFASRDRLHKDLSPFLLDEDQSFADGDQLCDELKRLSACEEVTGKFVAESAPLICSIWQKHMAIGFPEYVDKENSTSELSDAAFQGMIKEVMESISDAESKIPPPQRWPI